jgi:hypothetical protein
MGAGARAERAGEVVRDWVSETMGWGPEKVGVHPAPQLSTPKWDFVVLAQPGVHHGGDLYVMTDGERVLPASAENLGQVLLDEGLGDDPDALPAELVAQLFFYMAAVGRGRPVLEDGDRAVADAPGFEPPRVDRDGDGVRATFWSERDFGGPLERWTVRLRPDGRLESEAEPVA